jgi:hypothetical protein
MEIQRTESYDLMYLKKKVLGWKENHGIKNNGTEDSTGNITADKSHENFGKLYYRALLLT